MSLRIGSGPQLGTELVWPTGACPTLSTSGTSSPDPAPWVYEIHIDTSSMNPTENITAHAHIALSLTGDPSPVDVDLNWTDGTGPIVAGSSESLIDGSYTFDYDVVIDFIPMLGFQVVGVSSSITSATVTIELSDITCTTATASTCTDLDAPHGLVGVGFPDSDPAPWGSGGGPPFDGDMNFWGYNASDMTDVDHAQSQWTSNGGVTWNDLGSVTLSSLTPDDPVALGGSTITGPSGTYTARFRSRNCNAGDTCFSQWAYSGDFSVVIT